MTDDYFIDPVNGNDSASGTSPEKPWKTALKAQTFVDERRNGLGSALWFAAGAKTPDSVPYYSLAEASDYTGRKRFTVGTYGSGEKHVFSMYKELNVANSWVAVPAGGGVPSDVWSLDLANPANYTGYAGSENYNIGHLRVDGKIKPYRRDSVSQLVNAWDYVCAVSASSPDRMLYVKSPGGPPNLAAKLIEAAPPVNAAIVRSGTTLTNIELLGPGQHAFRGRSTGVITREVLLDMITTNATGGSRQAGNDGTPGTGSRLGNSVEVWIGARDFIIQRSEFNDAYDVAFTCQGDRDTSIGWTEWRNILFQYNIIKGASQGVEFWARQDYANSGGFQNIRVHHNLFLDDGNAWSAGVRNQAGRGTNLLTYGMLAYNVPTDIEMDHNVFAGVKDVLRYHQDGSNYASPAINDHDNTYIARGDQVIQFNDSRTMRQRAAWQAATGRERDSIFISTPTLPELATNAGKERQAIAKGLIGAAAAEIAMLSSTATTNPYSYTERIADISTSVYITPQRLGNSAFWSTQDVFKFEPWIAPFSGKVMGMVVDVTTAQAGATMRAAFLTRGSNIVSWRRLANAAPISAGSTGRKLFDLSASGQYVRQGDVIAMGVVLQGTAGAQLRAHTGRTNELVYASSMDANITSNLNGYIVTGVNGDNIPGVITTQAGDGNPMPVIELLIAPA